LSWLLSVSVSQNSNANPKIIKNPEGSVRSEQIGNKTECALLELADKLGHDFKTLRNKENVLKVFPFSS
jgi:P-type Ca2+ transporter type 2B